MVFFCQCSVVTWTSVLMCCSCCFWWPTHSPLPTPPLPFLPPYPFRPFPLLVLSSSHRYPCRSSCRSPRCFLWPMSNIANQFKLTSGTWSRPSGCARATTHCLCIAADASQNITKKGLKTHIHTLLHTPIHMQDKWYPEESNFKSEILPKKKRGVSLLKTMNYWIQVGSCFIFFLPFSHTHTHSPAPP